MNSHLSQYYLGLRVKSWSGSGWFATTFRRGARLKSGSGQTAGPDFNLAPLLNVVGSSPIGKESRENKIERKIAR